MGRHAAMSKLCILSNKGWTDGYDFLRRVGGSQGVRASAEINSNIRAGPCAQREGEARAKPLSPKQQTRLTKCDDSRTRGWLSWVGWMQWGGAGGKGQIWGGREESETCIGRDGGRSAKSARWLAGWANHRACFEQVTARSYKTRCRDVSRLTSHVSRNDFT